MLERSRKGYVPPDYIAVAYERLSVHRSVLDPMTRYPETDRAEPPFWEVRISWRVVHYGSR